jgi:hypothetical protein
MVGLVSTGLEIFMGSTFIWSPSAVCLPVVFNVELALPFLLPILDFFD